MVITLLMNSMYGTTIIKPVGTDTIVKDNRYDFGKYVSYNHSYIGSVIEVKGKLYISKAKTILSHFDYVHCGVGGLSMSNIIMNKVFRRAGGCDIKVYYQDTGSTHLNYDGVDKIENVHRERYGTELVGEELGDLHIDFSIGNANTEIYAIETLFLGRETHIYFRNNW